MIIELGHSFDIQLFAGKDEAEGISGEKEAFDAGKQMKTGDNPPDAGETEAQRAERFRALIEDEYKDLYDAQVQHIVKMRLKGSEETARKYKALAPVVELLEKKYGVAPGDAKALADALEGEERGREQRVRELSRRQYESWLEQTRKARESYPQLDIARELKEPRFRELLRSGVPVADAYELVHRDQLVESAAKDMEERISRRILSDARRPREGAIAAGSSALMGSDVSRMSRKARQDIIRRVQQGERISF